MEKDTTTPTPEMTPYEKTQELMRRFVAVPKEQAMSKQPLQHKSNPKTPHCPNQSQPEG